LDQAIDGFLQRPKLLRCRIIGVLLDRDGEKAKLVSLCRPYQSHIFISCRSNANRHSIVPSNTLDLCVTPKRRDFTRIQRDREFTRKTHRLASPVAPIDQLIGEGIARGRISELTGKADETSLAAAFCGQRR
jgi:hypothetical protein